MNLGLLNRRSGSSKLCVKAYDGSLESQATTSRKYSGTVLPYVGVACLGAILFGYHLGVVNGALEYLARILDLPTILFYKDGWLAQHLQVPLLDHLLEVH